FVTGRRGVLMPELEAGGADWTFPLRNSPCMGQVGTVTTTFTTTFGTVGSDPFASGDATLAFTFGGVPLATGGNGGAVAGFDPNNPSTLLVQLAILRPADNKAEIFIMAINPDDFHSGATFRYDLM